MVKNPPAKESLEVRKIPWRRKWQSTPIFFLGNPMDRGAWQATVQGVTKELDMSEGLKTKYSKLIIWIDSFNPHNKSLRVGQWMFPVLLFFCFLLVWLVGLAFAVVVAVFCFVLLHGTQNFSSLTRDWTCALCSGSTVLTTGLPGKSLSGC